MLITLVQKPLKHLAEAEPEVAILMGLQAYQELAEVAAEGAEMTPMLEELADLELLFFVGLSHNKHQLPLQETLR